MARKNSWSDGKLVSSYFEFARKYLPDMNEEELFEVLFDDCDFYNCVSELQLKQKLINYKNEVKER
ncbi:hypothetical protein [Viridibacillus arvi]|uniref:hypothetical protein n=1 Tax=Viridibacillus arvi TaxID=263475 RepID=UPI0034CD0586